MKLEDRFRESFDHLLIDDLTYGQIWANASHIAKGWSEVGLKRGDRVVLMFKSSPAHLACYLACAIGGFTAAPLASDAPPQAIRSIKPALVFKEPPALRERPFVGAFEAIEHTGIFAIIHTSGTTGQSKAVCFSLEGVLGIAESFGRLSGMNSKTVMHHILSMAHNAGFVNTLFAPMMCGGRILVDPFRGINARSFKGKGNFLVLTPRIAEALLKFHKHKERHPFWNYGHVQATAERLPDELTGEFLRAFGIRLSDCYGTTELGVPFIVDGRILPELKYRLDNENGLHVESPFIMQGYLEDGEVVPPATGYMDTGDVAKVENGLIKVHGRKKKRLGEELELSRKLHQKSVVERINQIREGKRPAPWVVELDPTSACNLACPDCISIKLLNQGGFLKERLVALANEMVEAGVKAVILIGGGEPMAHPAFGDIVDIFGRGGLHVGVTTNGTMISRYQTQLAEHAKWVRVSMDAGTPETYLRFRPAPNGVCRFDDVIVQMRAYAKVKTGKMGYSFLVLTDAKDNFSNVGDIYEAGRLAKEIGCDYVEIKPSYDLDHYLIAQPMEHVETAREQIATLRMLADDGFRVITPATLEDVLDGTRLHQPKEYTTCAVSEMRTLITPTGAYVCPYFRGKADKKIGDLTKQSFTEMWQNRPGVVNPSLDCRFHCIRHQSNLMLENWDGTQAVVEDYDWFV